MGGRANQVLERVRRRHAGGPVAAGGAQRHVARRDGGGGAPARSGQTAVRQQDEAREEILPLFGNLTLFQGGPAPRAPTFC